MLMTLMTLKIKEDEAEARHKQPKRETPTTS